MPGLSVCLPLTVLCICIGLGFFIYLLHLHIPGLPSSRHASWSWSWSCSTSLVFMHTFCYSPRSSVSRSIGISSPVPRSIRLRRWFCSQFELLWIRSSVSHIMHFSRFSIRLAQLLISMVSLISVVRGRPLTVRRVVGTGFVYWPRGRSRSLCLGPSQDQSLQPRIHPSND